MEPIIKPDIIFGPKVGTGIFNVNGSSLMPLANKIFCRIRLVNTAYVEKQITPEAIRYYATGLFWLRAIELRVGTYEEVISPEESEFCFMTRRTQFNIPEPLYLYYEQMNKTQTFEGEILRPTVPKLPTVKLDNIGGFFGRMDETSHIDVNLHSEYPTLGVCAEAICHAVSNDAPGPYVSVLETQQPEFIVCPIKNVQGYFNLAYRKEEAKNFYRHLGITAKEFPESVESTGFNYELMLAVSDFFATTKAFHLRRTAIQSMG